MLTRMLPDQISRFWDIIRYAIEESLPPTVDESPDKMNRILAALIGGSLQCWASYEKNGDSRRFEGLVVTEILFDDASNTRNLLIYCLYGYDAVSKESWRKGFEALAKWAVSKGCSRVIGYSDVPHILKIVERLGGEAKYRFISFPLNSVK